MKKIVFLVFVFLFRIFTCDAYADPYGPTLNELAQKYDITRNFTNLMENLSKETIDIRLGMTYKNVEKWAKNSKIYKIESKTNSAYKFIPKDEPANFYNLSFNVEFKDGKVVLIKTNNLNDFELNKNYSFGLRAFKDVKVNACWSQRKYFDPNSKKNGYDFVFATELSSSSDECTGSDRGNVTVAQPGLLYPNNARP
ncbi:MAG: hypothetical protein IJU76_06685 [Desulfovibrionaceae bacterium]|nr:hypothetical protein [Desulfovibrionaceae bacterium]